MDNKIFNRFYAGIGSRETPPGVEPIIQEVVFLLEKLNFVLRSGGAPGADSMFEKYTEQKEIYLPWKNFNNNKSSLFLDSMNTEIVERALVIARKYHPRWGDLSEGAKKLMTRNTFQILGQDLETPVKFVVCWTQGGGIKGGTGQAMRIANDLNIPIYNLYNKDSFYRLKLFLHYNT